MISTKKRQELASRPHQLGDDQKINIGNGGMGHKYLRLNQKRFRFVAMKRRGGKARKETID